jgi:hypothetical protein
MPKLILIFQFGSLFGSTRDMYVPATPANFSSPDGRFADALASTHACTTVADAPVNYRRYVPQRPQIFPGDGKMADVLASTLACA